MMYMLLWSPTIPMAEIKLLLAICAYCDVEFFQMDTTTVFISAALKPGEFIYCNPPSGVDLGLGSNGLPRGWKLRALLLKAITLQQCAGRSTVVFPF